MGMFLKLFRHFVCVYVSHDVYNLSPFDGKTEKKTLGLFILQRQADMLSHKYKLCSNTKDINYVSEALWNSNCHLFNSTSYSNFVAFSCRIHPHASLLKTNATANIFKMNN